MVEAVFFLALGIVIGHLLGILSAGFLMGDGVDWSRHECRTCRDWQDSPFTPTCGGDGPRKGERCEARDRCDAWRGGGK